MTSTGKMLAPLCSPTTPDADGLRSAASCAMPVRVGSVATATAVVWGAPGTRLRSGLSNAHAPSAAAHAAAAATGLRYPDGAPPDRGARLPGLRRTIAGWAIERHKGCESAALELPQPLAGIAMADPE